MKQAPLKEKIYEVEFEQLNTKEIEPLDSKRSILNSNLDIVVTIGNCKKSLKDVLEFKVDDIICLDKSIDEDL
ncbi:MAG: FliM/FliN family flagellar motor switch protein, partial [Cetobacterium sp.]